MIDKLRCVGGSHGMPFTLGKVYTKFEFIQDNSRVCVTDDNNQSHWVNVSMSGSKNIKAAGGVFRVMLKPVMEDV